MARCKLTRMNLRNIRKSREYQALLIDLVATNVVGKSAAEELLGYTIPAGLLSADPVTSDDDDDEENNGSGGESGGESGSTDKDPVVTSKVTLLNFDGEEWLTAEYDLTDDPTGEGIITFAKDAFDNDALNAMVAVELWDEYVEGETSLNNKYAPLDPQPEAPEAGMLIVTYVSTNGGKTPVETIETGDSGPQLDPSTAGGN